MAPMLVFSILEFKSGVLFGMGGLCLGDSCSVPPTMMAFQRPTNSSQYHGTRIRHSMLQLNGIHIKGFVSSQKKHTLPLRGCSELPLLGPTLTGIPILFRWDPGALTSCSLSKADTEVPMHSDDDEVFTPDLTTMRRSFLWKVQTQRPHGPTVNNLLPLVFNSYFSIYSSHRAVSFTLSGGTEVRMLFVMWRLTALLISCSVRSTDSRGIDPNIIEGVLEQPMGCTLIVQRGTTSNERVGL